MMHRILQNENGAPSMREAGDVVRSDGREPARRRRTVREHGPHPIDVFVGQRLREARILAGVSQEELGDAIGVSFQAVQKYEHGENRLSASRLFQAAQFLRRPVSFFFNDLEGAPEAADGGGFSRDELELVRHYRHIDDHDVRDNLLQVTRRISGLAPEPDPTAAEPAEA
jgi:transcriptional regulator with XRE-family HTH domain